MKFIDANGEKYSPSRWLTFNDVLLRPHKSRFNSRNDNSISMRTRVCDDFYIDTPLISANMDTVTGEDMAVTMSIFGGLGILHRFYKSKEEYILAIKNTKSRSSHWKGSVHPVLAFSVGCGDKWIDFVKEVTNTLELNRFIICVDVAHGHMEQSLQTVESFYSLKQEFKSNNINMGIVAGNVATPEGAYDLVMSGAGGIKVGVGGGSMCSTRIVTGHGVSQLSAIMQAREIIDKIDFDNDLSACIIADGGIRYSGDIVKAVSAGADTVMLGNMLAGTSCSAGDLLSLPDGSKRKIYRGQSSRNFLNDVGKKDVAAEGICLEIPFKGETEDVLKEIVGGIRSGMTYSGAGSFEELREVAEFIEISHNSWIESTPHASLNM